MRQATTIDVQDQTTVLPPLDPGHAPDPLAEFDRQLRRNSFFVQASLEQQGKLASRLDAYLTGLLDVLIEQGLVDVDRLREVVAANRQRQEDERTERLLEGGGVKNWPTVVVRDDPPEAPRQPSEPVDCAARMHICKAVCCTLKFPLSAEEIEAGRVKWDLGHPYVVRHSEEGYCVHNDRGTGGCRVYADRPQVCRAYSCAHDERIWKDFDAMVLNEEFLASRVPERFEFKPDRGGVPVTLRRRSTSGARAPGAAEADEMVPEPLPA